MNRYNRWTDKTKHYIHVSVICFVPCTDVACVIQIVLASQVKAILVNVFGGIVNCATVANGITNAYKTINLSIPVIVRLEGEHYREGAGCVDGSPTQYVIQAF